jgi:hypothetical protein
VAVTVSSIAVTPGFSETSTCLLLLPGKGCKIFVTFTPIQKGGAAGIMTINDSAAKAPQLVPLSGIGF